MMKGAFTAADAENAAGAQRRRVNSLRNLRVLCICGGESQLYFHSRQD
jgi:hypothetical protein